MSGHARQHWLETQARFAINDAMEIEIDPREIKDVLKTAIKGMERINVGFRLDQARADAARQLALAAELHRLWVGMDE